MLYIYIYFKKKKKGGFTKNWRNLYFLFFPFSLEVSLSLDGTTFYPFYCYIYHQKSYYALYTIGPSVTPSLRWSPHTQFPLWEVEFFELRRLQKLAIACANE